jgi:hypothetical protein
MATVRPATWIPDARSEPSLRLGNAFGRILTDVRKAFAINDRETHTKPHKGMRFVRRRDPAQSLGENERGKELDKNVGTFAKSDSP